MLSSVMHVEAHGAYACSREMLDRVLDLAFEEKDGHEQALVVEPLHLTRERCKQFERFRVLK